LNSAPHLTLRARLEALAVTFALPYLLPNTDDAIALACDLLVEDLDTPATVGVAALSYGTPFSESEPLIRAMLAEHEVPAPGPGATERERFGVVLRAFSGGGLGLNAFLTALYRGVPEWHEQSEVQRSLIRLAIHLDLEISPERKARIVTAMREAAGAASETDAIS
jgi:hypothetical protein